MGHVGPAFNLKKKKEKQTKALEFSVHGQKVRRLVDFFFNFSLLNLLSSIPEFMIVGFCRVKHEKCSTRQGLRVGTKNTGFHKEFR